MKGEGERESVHTHTPEEPMFPVITICGSLRMGRELWDEVARSLSSQGYIVLTIHVWEWEALHKGEMQDLKETLDLMHFQKIDMSKAIYVINKDGYIGPSTSKEITHARETGKIILYHETLSSSTVTPVRIRRDEGACAHACK